MKNKTKILKGFRDFLPADLVVKNYVINTLVNTFQAFGFQPLETPALEYLSTLIGKSGADTEKLIYAFKDRGNRWVGLRYDLTVPTARVLASSSQKIPLPFKRYQIQPVWRADKPQAGRFRQFTQSDIDIFGPPSPLNDFEIILITYQALTKLGLKNFTIAINSRQTLSEILSAIGVKKNQNIILSSLDKLQKIGPKRVQQELKSKGLSSTQIQQLFNNLKTAKPDKYLQEVFNLIDQSPIPKSAYKFEPALARGFDYYTGPIFETYISNPQIGSITGGGRYDQLISQLGGPEIGAVGTSFGLDRIIISLKQQKLINISSAPAKILIANISPQTQIQSLNLACQLRSQNIPALFYPYTDKLSKQIKYALRLKIPYLVILGPDEIKNNQISLKNLNTQSQKLVSLDQIIKLCLK